MCSVRTDQMCTDHVLESSHFCMQQTTPNKLPLTVMAPVTPPCTSIILPTSPSRASYLYSVTIGTDIADDLLKSCADLFSSNYGIWGAKASIISKYTKAGQ